MRRAAGDADATRALLADLLRRAATTLSNDPRDERLHRVIDRTYLRPAPTQERAAAVLDLPRSTDKRHLRRGIDRIVDALWERELHATLD